MMKIIKMKDRDSLSYLKLNYILRINVIFIVLFIIIKLFSQHFIYNSLKNGIDIISSYNYSEYEYKGEVNSIYPFDNSFYYNLSISSIRDQEFNNFNSTIYMQRNDVKYKKMFYMYYSGKEIENYKLENNELAISKNFHELYNVNIGDLLRIRVSDLEFMYQVKYIFENYYDHENISLLYNYNPLVILGENSDILDNSNDKTLMTYSSKALDYLATTSLERKSKTISSINAKIYTFYTLNLLLLFIITIFVEFILNKRFMISYYSLRQDLIPKKKLVLFTIVDIVYVYSAIFIPVILISIVFKYNLIFNLVEFIGIIITSLLIRIIRLRSLSYDKIS